MKLNSLVIVAATILLLVSFWQRNSLPANLDIHDAVLDEPRQLETRKKKFATQFEDVGYTVEPKYAYELHGIVVSYRHHEGNSRMHRRAGDHLNMLDVCVVWGENADTELLRAFDFWNGIFTCVFKTRDGEAWDAFRQHELSNNHLISDDPRIRERVRSIAIGDQIRVSGYLASYKSTVGGERGTSTTRYDTGDGACETIYVEDFEIIEAAVHPWHFAMFGALAVLLAALITHFRRPYRPYQDE